MAKFIKEYKAYLLNRFYFYICIFLYKMSQMLNRLM